MDKTETQELMFSLKLILIGVFFWVIKVKYFTFFWLSENYFLNVIGLEIIGTILILIGIIIIHRVYPFAYSSLAILLNWLILGINLIEILNFFLFKNYYIFLLNKYTPFIMSLMLFVISKLLKSGTKYFGNLELSKKWEYIGIVIFFGFSIPYYIFISLEICGYISVDSIKLTRKFILFFLPLTVIVLSFFFYYLHAIIMSFKFLLNIKKNNK
ncbi:MAG: hypothetical protein JXB50_11610 [Spirochaetes bacterium]|nr:hypothetical protein [Spirochaetota bacterium]